MLVVGSGVIGMTTAVCLAEAGLSVRIVTAAQESLGPARCVHNYGHGGSGVALSWGCAHEVASMLTAPGREAVG